MSLLLLALTAASAAPRECWTVKPVTGRVRDNVGHQGEELVYRLVAAGLRQAPPRAVYWPWPILPWSREVLEATLPAVDQVERPRAVDRGVRPSSLVPKNESLCEGRTAGRRCALVAVDCYETPLRPRSEQ